MSLLAGDWIMDAMPPRKPPIWRRRLPSLAVAVGAGLALFLVDAGEAYAKKRVGLKPGFRSHSSRAYRGYRPYRYGGGYYGYGRFGYGGFYGPWGGLGGFGLYYDPFYWGRYHSHGHYEEHTHDGHTHSHSHRPTATTKAWRQLVGGERKRALGTFAKEAKRDSTNTMAKLGYSLSAAELGNLDLGVMAMRRVARSDAALLFDAPLEAEMESRVRQLIDVYHPKDHPDGHDDDAHFMAAALLYIAGDLEGADDAVRAAIDDGDRDDSTLALQDAIIRSLDRAAREVEDSDAEEGGAEDWAPALEDSETS